MGKVVYLPGFKPVETILHKRQNEEYMILEILKTIAVTFIDLKLEMGATSVWYDSVQKFIVERNIPELSTTQSVESALDAYKAHWREVIRDVMPNK